MPQRIFQHFPPSRRIEESDSNRMLHEAGNARCRSRRDQCANFCKLMILERDGDLRGGHTKGHTMQKAPIESGLRGNPALSVDGASGADLSARDLLRRRLDRKR